MDFDLELAKEQSDKNPVYYIQYAHARIASILRRAPTGAEPAAVRFGPFRFDPSTLELTRDGEPVRLTASEAALLRCLALQPGRALSRAELGARAKLSGSDRAVDVQMVRLRRKLEEDPRQPRWLLTLRGAGYVLRTGS
jgi:two-component system phosphate regulon response regulator OmpR